VSLNLDETQAFRRQPDDKSTRTEVTIRPPSPESLPALLTRSTFPDAGPAPLRRGETARQQIAAAEAIAKHGRNSRTLSVPALFPVSPIAASPFQSQEQHKPQVRLLCLVFNVFPGDTMHHCMMIMKQL